MEHWQGSYEVGNCNRGRYMWESEVAADDTAADQGLNHERKRFGSVAP